MIPAYICDDEPAVCRLIEEIVNSQVLILNGDIGPVRVAEKPADLLEMQRQDTVPAIYFLDIDFPGQQTGLELAAKLRKRDPRGFIVFITGHNDLAFETFRYRIEAMDYIVKSPRDVMTERIQQCLTSIQQRLQDEPPGGGAFFSLKLFDTIRHIPMGRIRYFEAVGHKHLVRLHMDDETLDFYHSLGGLEGELGAGFWRCHRGFLVNRARIAAIHLRDSLVQLDSGDMCLLSRKAKKEYGAQTE